MNQHKAMNPSAEKIKFTISYDWLLNAANIPENESIDSPFFGSKQTRFHLSASKRTCTEKVSIFNWIHLDSSRQKIVSLNYYLQSSPEVRSGGVAFRIGNFQHH